MKKLSKINLLNLSQTELEKREESMLKGGQTCPCVTMCMCSYAGSQQGPNDDFFGGSSTNANGDANINNAHMDVKS